MLPPGITERRQGNRRLRPDRRNRPRGGRRAVDSLLPAVVDAKPGARAGAPFVIVRLGRRASDPLLKVPASLAATFLHRRR